MSKVLTDTQAAEILAAHTAMVAQADMHIAAIDAADDADYDNGIVGIALKVTRRANEAFKVAAKAANEGEGFPVGHYLLTILYPTIGEALPVLAKRGRKAKTAEEKAAEKAAAEAAIARMEANEKRLETLRAAAKALASGEQVLGADGKPLSVEALLASLAAD